MVEPSSGSGPVVVGVDGSPQAEAALRHALTRAAEVGADLTVVHGWEPDGFGAENEQLRLAAAERVRSAVAEAVATLRATGVGTIPAVRHRSVPGRTARILVEESRSARELVLGASGRRARNDVVFGTVIATCLAAATVPVTVVDGDGCVVSRTRPASGT